MEKTILSRPWLIGTKTGGWFLPYSPSCPVGLSPAAETDFLPASHVHDGRKQSLAGADRESAGIDPLAFFDTREAEMEVLQFDFLWLLVHPIIVRTTLKVTICLYIFGGSNYLRIRGCLVCDSLSS